MKTRFHQASHARRSSGRRGFVLLEIILALALFVMVAVGMTRALSQMSQTAKSARQEAQVLRVLESVLAEVSHQVELKPTTIEFPATEDNIGSAASIEKMELETQNKIKLDHLFLIRAEAWVKDGTRGTGLHRSMETYVYSPNSPGA